MANESKRQRKSMPKHIDSINQFREFIDHYDRIRAEGDNVTKKWRQNYNSILSRLRKRLNVANPEDLAEDIRNIVGQFDGSLAACMAKRIPRIRLGSTHLLSVRLIPSLLKSYTQSMSTSENAIIPKVELVYDMHYRKADERTFYTAPDLSLTYRSIEFAQSDGIELVKETWNHRCVITKNDNPLAALKEPIERGEFRWEYLRDKQVAILPENAALPNFPYKSIANVAQLVIVRAVVEAHEYVRAGNADLAFTHVDFLSTNELRDFTVIRLSHVPVFGKTRLCLLRNIAPLPEEKIVAVNMLTNTMVNYLEHVEVRHAESSRLTDAFNRYENAYFTSCVRVGSKGAVERRWFRGRLHFEVFVSHVTSAEQPIWFVKAIHTVDGPGGIRQRLFMFGRVHSRTDGGLMSWFGTYAGKDQGSLRLTFSRDELEADEHAFIGGILTGRPNWLPQDDQLYVTGACILHKFPDLSDEDLNELLTQMRHKAKKLAPGSVDPMNPWELPKGV